MGCWSALLNSRRSFVCSQFCVKVSTSLSCVRGLVVGAFDLVNRSMYVSYHRFRCVR